MKPLVSIIIPTYNRVHLIGETLESVLSQTYQNWECIVVDDGSTDYTNELMEFYCKKDDRIQYHHRPANRPKGANTCRNYGFELSKGDFIQWLDSDDLLAKNKIDSQIQILKDEDQDTLAICKFGYIQSNNKKVIRERVNTYRNFVVSKDLLEFLGIHKEFFPSHVYLTSRDLINKSKLWNENLYINQDGEFYCRLLLLGKSVKFSRTLVYYRISNDDNISLVNTFEKGEHLILSWKLINNYLRDAGLNKHPYVESAKKVLYEKIRNKYPELIRENISFFSSILPIYKRILKTYKK